MLKKILPIFVRLRCGPISARGKYSIHTISLRVIGGLMQNFNALSSSATQRSKLVRQRANLLLARPPAYKVFSLSTSPHRMAPQAAATPYWRTQLLRTFLYTYTQLYDRRHDEISLDEVERIHV
jgi:hypothetical protein